MALVAEVSMAVPMAATAGVSTAMGMEVEAVAEMRGKVAEVEVVAEGVAEGAEAAVAVVVMTAVAPAEMRAGQAVEAKVLILVASAVSTDWVVETMVKVAMGWVVGLLVVDRPAEERSAEQAEASVAVAAAGETEVQLAVEGLAAEVTVGETVVEAVRAEVVLAAVAEEEVGHTVAVVEPQGIQPGWRAGRAEAVGSVALRAKGAAVAEEMVAWRAVAAVTVVAAVGEATAVQAVVVTAREAGAASDTAVAAGASGSAAAIVGLVAAEAPRRAEAMVVVMAVG